MDAGNVISGSSAFSKSSLHIWKFLVHVLLNPRLENFEHSLLVCEMSETVIVWTSFGISLSLSLFFFFWRGWQECTEELYKKDLHDPDNHDGVITYLEPDILEREVKWALVSITTHKASEVEGIPAELFQILKDDAVKVLHSICHKFGKLSSGHRTGKSQFSFISQTKAMPKNVQTTTDPMTLHYHLTAFPKSQQRIQSQEIH